MSNRPTPEPVTDDNPPRPTRSARPAPPDTAPAEQPAPPAPSLQNGVATRPQHAPAEPAEQGDMLASLLAAGTSANASASELLAGLAAMRTRPVDPMTDFVPDGTRMLRWVQAAIAHQASMTGRTQQDVLRDALLGITPISPQLLDVHYLNLYGRERP